MPIAATPLAERIARVLAGLSLSDNGHGDQASASASVDRSWEKHVKDAMAVIRTMREPDPDMVRVGNEKVWAAMVDALINSNCPQDDGNPLAPPINIDAS